MNLINRRLPLVLLAFVALSTSSCASGPVTSVAETAPAAVSPAADVPRSATLVVGSISSDPVEEAEEFRPFAEALAVRLVPAGIQRVKVRVTGSVSEMTRLVQAGEVDLYLDSPFPALTVAQASGAIPMLKRWKDGVADYRTVVFVPADSSIRTAADLAGARVAFDDEVSTSGYFLPTLALLEQGLRPVPMSPGPAPGAAPQVRYAFTGDEKNTLFWVKKGRAEAGAMAEHDLADLTGDAPQSMRVLLTSPSVPRHLVVHRSDLEPARVAAVRAALLGLDDDAAGKAALAEFADTDRFEDLSSSAIDELAMLLARFSAGAK